MEDPSALERAEELKRLLDLPKELVKAEFDKYIPSELTPPAIFWACYSEEQVTLGRRSCLLLWTATSGRLVPREFQLQATIALISGKDCLVDVGTGYGKTLCMIMPCLLTPQNITMVISPLKRLQAVQVQEFERYGIKTVAINEDTPSDLELWQDIANGIYSALLVQPEQLFMNEGHLSRLARMISKDRQFTQRIKILHVDEAHFIHSAGLEHYGLSAFRPAWSWLGELRIKLRKDLAVQALSGTQPPHIKKTITKCLLFDDATLCSIKLSSNRPNTAYATHPIVGELTDFRNLDFPIPNPYPDGYLLPKTLIFHDSIDGATGATRYTSRRLPEHLQNRGTIKHYHGRMSKEYLTNTYDDFSKPDGMCRILHATEGASTGLDIPDIDVVIQYGVPRDVPTTLQRGGRGGRNSLKEALFLIMYEPWAMTIDLDVADVDFTADPDHPNVSKLVVHSTKKDRTGHAILTIIQSVHLCLRGLFAKYLADKSLDALRFTTPDGCCDRHPGSQFHIRHYFKGRFLYQDGCDLFYGDIDEPDRQKIVPPPKPKRKASPKTRPPKDRTQLVTRLYEWRRHASENDLLAGVRPPSFIITDKSIVKVSKVYSKDITTEDQLVNTLAETEEWREEWAAQILHVIKTYDAELTAIQNADEARRKRAKGDETRLAFEEDSARNVERIQQEVIQRFAGTSRSAYTMRTLQPLSQNVPSSASMVPPAHVQQSAAVSDSIVVRWSQRNVPKKT